MLHRCDLGLASPGGLLPSPASPSPPSSSPEEDPPPLVQPYTLHNTRSSMPMVSHSADMFLLLTPPHKPQTEAELIGCQKMCRRVRPVVTHPYLAICNRIAHDPKPRHHTRVVPPKTRNVCNRAQTKQAPNTIGPHSAHSLLLYTESELPAACPFPDSSKDWFLRKLRHKMETPGLIQ